MRKYFAYIRVSTAKQGERGSSLQEQRSAIEAYAARADFPIAAWFEEQETAAKQGRTVFSRMLAELERGDAQGVLIHKIDRSARNLKDWANLGDLIDRGIDVQFVHDSFDLRSRGGRLSADIQAVVAADYIRNLRDEVKKGFYGRLKQGLYPLPAPIGYLDRGGGNVKEIDPIRGPLVRDAFDLYATGKTNLHALRMEMARRGLVSKGGKALSLTFFSKMLHNPFYIGIIRLQRTGERFEGRHEPLISKTIFDRVHDILNSKTVLRQVKHEFTFRRLVRCGRCGRHLIGEKQKSRYVYYRCQVAECRGTITREEDLDHAVQMALAQLQFDSHEQRCLNQKVAGLKKGSVQAREQLRASLALRLRKCEERLGRLTDAYIDQTIDKELFEERKKAILDQRAALRSELLGLPTSALAVDRAIANIELGSAALSGYKLANLSERRGIIESVTSNFTLHGKEPEITLRSPFREMAIWRKSHSGGPRRRLPRTRAAQILDIFLKPSDEEKRGAETSTFV